jgi:hypothetical protein
VDSDAVGMPPVIGFTIIYFLGVRVNTHLGVTHGAPSAVTAAQVMMDDISVTYLDVTYTSSYLNHLTTRLMATSLQLI